MPCSSFIFSLSTCLSAETYGSCWPSAFAAWSLRSPGSENDETGCPLSFGDHLPPAQQCQHPPLRLGKDIIGIGGGSVGLGLSPPNGFVTAESKVANAETERGLLRPLAVTRKAASESSQ